MEKESMSNYGGDSDSFEEWKQHLENSILSCKKLSK